MDRLSTCSKQEKASRYDVAEKRLAAKVGRKENRARANHRIEFFQRLFAKMPKSAQDGIRVPGVPLPGRGAGPVEIGKPAAGQGGEPGGTGKAENSDRTI